MTTGSLLMACLLLAPAALPADVWPMNTRDFQIPIRIDPARRNEIRELVLYYSPDQGRSWEQRAVATPDKEAFEFVAPADGLYWFNVQIVDKKGGRDPANIMEAPPGAKILVDTIKPELRILSAERQGEEIVVKWESRDDNLDPASFKLEYRASEPAGFWNPVAFNPANGQVAFRPNLAGPVTVRLQVQDLIGNVAVDEKGVPAGTGTGIAPASSGAVAELPKMPPPASASSGWTPIPATTTPPRKAPDRFDSPPPLTSNPLPMVTGTNTTQLVASSETSGALAPSPGTTGGARPPREALPPLQLVNSRQVTLDYEVAKFGASGLGNVELYVTRDEGRTWQRAPVAGEPNVGLPMSPDLKGLPPSLRKSLTVELPGEGIYGFYLVVKSGAGLGKPSPQNGTLPQMRLEVDTTAPVANLFAPEPDPGKRDALVIRWNATDNNLAPKPILIQWSERKDGIWETIGGGELANTGSFSWKLPANVPASVYLRLIVRDTAGNTAVAETPQPILVDLNEPEVKILGLTTTPRPGER